VCKTVSGVCGDLTGNPSPLARCPRLSVLNLDSFDFEAIAALPFAEKQMWFYDRMADLQIPSNEVYLFDDVLHLY